MKYTPATAATAAVSVLRREVPNVRGRNPAAIAVSTSAGEKSPSGPMSIVIDGKFFPNAHKTSSAASACSGQLVTSETPGTLEGSGQHTAPEIPAAHEGSRQLATSEIPGTLEGSGQHTAPEILAAHEGSRQLVTSETPGTLEGAGQQTAPEVPATHEGSGQLVCSGQLVPPGAQASSCAIAIASAKVTFSCSPQ